MPNGKISQIQVSGTTYDICDATARDSLDTLANSMKKIVISNASNISVAANDAGYFRFILDQIYGVGQDLNWRILSIDDVELSTGNLLIWGWRVFGGARGGWVKYRNWTNSSITILASYLKVGVTLFNIEHPIFSNNLLVAPSPANSEDASRFYSLNSTADEPVFN